MIEISMFWHKRPESEQTRCTGTLLGFFSFFNYQVGTYGTVCGCTAVSTSNSSSFHRTKLQQMKILQNQTNDLWAVQTKAVISSRCLWRIFRWVGSMRRIARVREAEFSADGFRMRVPRPEHLKYINLCRSVHGQKSMVLCTMFQPRK